MTTMKAIGLVKATGGVELLEEFETPIPKVGSTQVLIKIEGTGLNPVDTKLRKRNPGPIDEPKILGHDGVGIVHEVGSDAKLFKVGDRVWTAGTLAGNGTDAPFMAVEEEIVGFAPKSIPGPEAAAVPLVLLTAWEGLFEQLQLQPNHKDADKTNAAAGKSLLVLPGAGGVGSLVIQLAKQLCSGLVVIATASRPESVAACKALGADIVINHRQPLQEQLKTAEGLNGDGCVDYIYNAFDTSAYFDQYCDIIKPLGKIVSIVETDKDLPMTKLMAKRVCFSWELMFTRSMFGVDPIQQHYILNEGAKLIDKGLLKLPQVQVEKFTVENLQKAHAQQESGKVIGKQVLSMVVE